MRSNNKSFQLGILIGIALSALFVIIAISFIEISWLPRWEDIFCTKYSSSDTETDSVTFLDVGQGDAILIRSNGRYMLIDCGIDEKVIRKTAKSIKNSGNNYLECLCITHWHDDHSAAVEGVFDTLNVRTALLPKMIKGNIYCEHFKNVLSTKADTSPEMYTAIPGMVVNIGDFEITVLSYNPDCENENDTSIVLMAKCRDIKFLLMGDAENQCENELILNKINFDCDVLKVAHHGSKNSTSSAFLKTATPKYAVISCGKDNIYNHPDTITLERLDDYNAKVFRTDLNGEITFTVNQDDVSVTVEK